MPEFSSDWFSESIPYMKLVLKDLKGVDNTVFLEIGSFEGRSAIWFLDNILTGKNCGLLCVDDFSGIRKQKDGGVDISGIKPTFIENMKPYEGRYKMLSGRSQDVLRTSDYDGMIDAIYVDGSHRADDTLTDMINSYYMLKTGGVMMVDDYLWNFNRYPPAQTPKLAIDSFILNFKEKIDVLVVTNKFMAIKKVY